MDGPGGQVLGEADPEGGLRELGSVVVVVQHGAQHRGRGRQGPRAAVTSLDCRRELQNLTVRHFWSAFMTFCLLLLVSVVSMTKQNKGITGKL